MSTLMDPLAHDPFAITKIYSKLMEEKYDGMYLIRGSNNVESEKV